MKIISKFSAITYLFFLLYFFLGLFLVNDYGIGIEEHFQRKSGFYWLNYLLDFTNFYNLKISVASRLETINQISNLAQIESHLNYGILFDLPTAFFETILDLQEKEIFLFRHFVNFTVFFISGIFFYKILTYKFKSEIIVLFGLLIYLLIPKSFGSSFFDSKDLFFLSILTINFFFYIKFEKKRNLHNLVLFSFFFAFSISSRIFGLAVPISFIAIELISLLEKKKIHQIKFIFLFFVFLIIFLFLHWPYLWIIKDNIFQFFVSFEVKTITKVYFDGLFFNSNNLPISYIPKLIFFKTPIFIILLFLIGFFLITKRIFNRILIIDENNSKRLWLSINEKIDIFIITNLCIVIVHYVSKNPNLYGGFRHYIFINFFISYLAACSLNFFYIFFRNKKIILNTIYALISILFLSLINSLIIYHPYQTYYFNEFLNNKKKSNYEIDTQSLSRVDALNFILSDAKNLDKIKIATASWTPLEEALYYINKKDREKLIFLGTSNKIDADYIYTNHFYEVNTNLNDKYDIPDNFSKLKELVIDGSKIFTIFKK